MSRSDLAWSIAISVVLSLFIALIEIPSKSKTSLRACLITQSLWYWLVLSFGNVITTIAASAAVVKMPASLAPYDFLFAAFCGVFGFETILKNTNITMFDKGVLTIQNWIEKALSAAAAAAIDEQENFTAVEGARLEKTLMTLSELEINTRVLQKMGSDAVPKLDEAASLSSADRKHYKVLQLVAALTRSEAAALLNAKK